MKVDHLLAVNIDFVAKNDFLGRDLFSQKLKILVKSLLKNEIFPRN